MIVNYFTMTVFDENVLPRPWKPGTAAVDMVLQAR